MSVTNNKNFKLPLRVGIIGTGFGQQVHIPAFKSDPRCIVAAICSKERAKEIAETHNIEKYFTAWQELVHDHEVDFVAIAVPPYLQERIASESFEAGKLVFCEKPLSTSISSARLLADKAVKTNLINMIDFEFPEIPQWKRAKKYIETDQLGAIHYVCINWHVETHANRNLTTSWKSDFCQGGGILNLFVSHCFYNIEWILGEIKSLRTLLTKSPLDSRNAPTVCLIHLILESGATVSLNVCSSASLSNSHRLEFYGNRASMILENQTSDPITGFKLFFGDRESKMLEPITHNDDWMENSGDGRVKAVSCLISRFIDGVVSGKAQNPDLLSGLRVQQLIEAAQQSSQSQQWVACSRKDLIEEYATA